MKGFLRGIALLCLSLGSVAFPQGDEQPQFPAISPNGHLTYRPSERSMAMKPCIWVNSKDPSKSRIVGTYAAPPGQRKSENATNQVGIVLYNLAGDVVQEVQSGPLKSCDLRYDVPAGDEQIDLLVTEASYEMRLKFYQIDRETGHVSPIGALSAPFPISASCLFRYKRTLQVAIFGLQGRNRQYQLKLQNKTLEFIALYSPQVSGVMSCTADDANNWLYLSQTGLGVGILSMDPRVPTLEALFASNEGHWAGEQSGVAILGSETSDGGYVAVPDTTNKKGADICLYNRFRRDETAEKRGCFRIEGLHAPQISAACAMNLGSEYPEGLAVTTTATLSHFSILSLGDLTRQMGIDAIKVSASASPDIDMSTASIVADAETEPVTSGDNHADDPAVWVHPTDPSKSLIIGTNKLKGLMSYNLKGQKQQEVLSPGLNNVDLRYGFPLSSGSTIDLLAVSDMAHRALALYTIDPSKRNYEKMEFLHLAESVSDGGVYGACMYHSKRSGKFYGIVTTKNSETGRGGAKQYEIFEAEKEIRTKLVQEWELESVAEGCVADDEFGVLYIAEEGRGIWRFPVEPPSGKPGSNPKEKGVLVGEVDSKGGNLGGELEGLAIYTASGCRGYLIVSAQRSNKFTVLDRANNTYVGAFDIRSHTVDDVTETDGIEVVSFPLGDGFPSGAFVAQDGRNTGDDDVPWTHNNFKIVSWERIAGALGLLTDTTVNPRTRTGDNVCEQEQGVSLRPGDDTPEATVEPEIAAIKALAEEQDRGNESDSNGMAELGRIIDGLLAGEKMNFVRV